MYEYSYMMDDEFGTAVGIVYMLYYLFTFLIGVAGYILSSVGLHTIAKRRGITNPWLAWIPLVRVWIVGSISDQYRYITRGQIKNKRKILLILEIVTVVLLVVMVIMMAMFGAEMAVMGMELSDEQAMSVVAGFALRMVGVVLLIGVVGIIGTVFHYMAMYDVYTSVNPPYSVVFLVLSIIFNITEPYFIFFNRKKDGGMPPRCDIPVEPVHAEPEVLPIQPPIQDLLEEPAPEESAPEEPVEE